MNIKELQLLGYGTQGKVYKINSRKCIKIFRKKYVCRAELESLAMAQIDAHFPILYSYGDDYIIRELINGIELDKYLSLHPLTKNISNKIIELYKSMNSIGYTRLDTALFHIFITPSKELKLIDTAKAMKKKTIYPSLIIKGLNNLGYKKEFLNFVEISHPEIFAKWFPYYENKGKLLK